MPRGTEKAVYLDYAATCPVDRRVLEAMLPYFTEEFGNPACNHAHGRAAEDAVELAREQVAAVIGADPSEIVFTSGATESDNLAIKGAAHPLRDGGRPHVITVVTEHKAVLNACACLETEGHPVTYLPVDGNGLIDLDRLWNSIGPNTGLVSIMSANNETGVMQDLVAIGQICRERRAVLHVDAAQSFGKLPLDVKRTGIALLSISGHKIYGPKGVGALYIQGGEDSGVEPQMDGGGQECNLRSGTLNVPAIVGLGAAAALADRGMEDEARRAYRLRTMLGDGISRRVPGTYETAPHSARLPGTLHLYFPGVSAVGILRGLAGKVSVTSASACVAGSDDPSHVMLAMGHPAPESTIRFTVGRPTTDGEIDRATRHVADVVGALRRVAGQRAS